MPLAAALAVLLIVIAGGAWWFLNANPTWPPLPSEIADGLIS
jgi:hypothetical protein